MNESGFYDAIMIGAGHNGLVCAAYLAKAGLRTLVLEQREVVGGACITESLFPGCRVSSAACWYGMLRPEIIVDLELYKHGLDPYPMDPQVLALFPNGRHLFIWLDNRKTAWEVARFAPKDALRDVCGLYRFNRYTDRVLEVIAPLFLRPPLNSDAIAQAFSDHGFPQVYHEVFNYSVAEIIDRFLYNDELKAAIAFSAMAIANTSPFTPGTAYDLFYMMAAETRGVRKAWGFARGGMGSVTAALAASARSFGTEIRTDCQVEQVIIEGNRAVGIALANGLEIRSHVVVSNADPKRTFLNLLPRDCLADDFSRRVSDIQMDGSSSVVHFLLKGLPQFRGFRNSGVGKQHCGMIVIAPSLDYLDRAWHDATVGKISKQPVLTMSMQSVTDKSIAPPGKHVLSVFVQFTPYHLTDGTWETTKTALVERVLDTIELYAPNFRSILLDYVAFTPVDLERKIGLTGGHAEHGDMSMNQLFRSRPVPGWTHYRTPVRNFYLCGAGAHPGGTVTGAPGFNAAHTILADMESYSDLSLVTL